MKSSEIELYRSLRREVDQAGKRYETAQRRVLTLTGKPDFEAGPALLQATEVLREDMKIYIDALRRLAYYTADQTSDVAEEQPVHSG
jgi:hypothetical protein